MSVLETRIPPPFVAVFVAACMWLIAQATPAIGAGGMLRVALTAALALSAAVFGVLGFRAFGRARTTIDPLHIDRASALVTRGIYGVTRNPMYVALTMLLAAWACYLWAPWTLAGPLAFVAFITRFQIMPEEVVLQGIFGDAYASYRRRVRRWI